LNGRNGFRVSGFEFRVSGFGFRVSGFGFRVSGFGFRVSGLSLVHSAILSTTNSRISSPTIPFHLSLR
jgi:hypothetical protein